MSGWRAAAAAALVGGAVLLVGLFIDGRSSDSPGGGGPTASGGSGNEQVAGDGGSTLACTISIESACESAAAVMNIATSEWKPSDGPIDRGVILAPIGDLTTGGIDIVDAPIVASSPIVVAAWRDRAQILEAYCDQIDATCIAAALGQDWPALAGPSSWGNFKLGLGDPTQSEASLLAWLLLSDSASDSQLASLGGSLRIRAATDVGLMGEVVSFGDSRADAVVAQEVAIVNQFNNAIGRGGRLEIGYPVEGPWVQYAAVTFGFGSGGLADDLQSEAVREAFTAAGLRPAGGVVGAVPEPMGEPGLMLPAADDQTRGTLLARWEEYS